MNGVLLMRAITHAVNGIRYNCAQKDVKDGLNCCKNE
jgi:hypothetical protein